MRKFMRLVLAVMVLMSLVSAIYAAPPDYGTVKGNTWTDTWTLSQPNFTYTITPVPELRRLESGPLLCLPRGSDFAISGAELEVFIITDFDDSELAEHELDGPIFTGRAYKFNEPGQYAVWLKVGSDYRQPCIVEVN